MTTSERGQSGGIGRVPAPRAPGDHRSTPRPTVGLVTAIPEELVAVQALLDDTFEHNVAEDLAYYALGTLPSRDVDQSHRVVLTKLAATATNAAANGCTNLIRSFPSIIAIIMVGTAAGVPCPHRPERHVRLGDIVVATHGIVDYDHVRAVEGGSEPRQQFPRPSPRLSHCADMLRVDELSGRRTWEEWLDPTRRPELRDYGRPADRTDVLHDQVGWPLHHPRRADSGHRRGLPKIHYGAIGSADRSLRDAATRDRLAARHGFLAVEMEGAGIGTGSFLNSREWFVVRGISDYGDKHRADGWRRYASLGAAAYVRALLSKCLPLEPGIDRHQTTVDSFH